MIELPRIYYTNISSAKQPTGITRFQRISEEDKASLAMERRLAPTRREPRRQKQQIERRVSSDRRYSSFSSKA